jgi:hypothetical protein
MHKAVVLKDNNLHYFGVPLKFEEVLDDVKSLSVIPDKFLSDRRH